MKIGEARQLYASQQNKLLEQKRTLDKQLEKENTSMSEEERGVVLELSSQVNKAFEETNQFLDALMDQMTALENAEVAKQQAESGESAVEDMAKCLETARRIASGAKVPSSDAKKLMEFSMELYMTAINAAVMNTHKSNEEYDSLWEEDTSEEEPDNIDEEINETEAVAQEPEVVSLDVPTEE